MQSLLCLALVGYLLDIGSSTYAQEGRTYETPFVCAGYCLPKMAAGRPKRVGTHIRGRQMALVIFAKFRDEAPQDSLAPPYAVDLFDPHLPGSLSHFYDAMSLGQLQLTGSVLPKRYTSDHPASFYVSSSDTVVGQYGLVVQDILRKVDEEVDFGEYDNDGWDGVPNSGDDDGYVDLVFINLRSIPDRFLIGLATGIAALGLTEDWASGDLSPNGTPTRVRGDGHAAGSGGCVQRVWGFHHAVGSMAHEYGHILGLPDLYDTSFLHHPDQPPEEDSGGIGRWGLMGWGALGWHGDDGPVPFCAWSRGQLGWSPVQRITEDVEIGGTIYRIQIGPERKLRRDEESDTLLARIETECFLIEYRSREGGYYDRNVPKDGVLIWHVGAGSTNEDEERKLVDLECADGRYDDEGNADRVHGRDDLDLWAHDATYTIMHGGNLGDAGDVFDGEQYTAFTLVTNPSSDNDKGEYGEASTGISFTDIRREGERMVIDVGLPRWSGSISQDVRWFGEVDVIGDVVVEESGILRLDPNTVVWFAPRDVSHGGMDPDRCELVVKGRLDLADTARFVGVGDGKWSGIALSTRSQIRNMLRLLGSEMEDAERGIFYLEPWSGMYARLEPLVWFGTVDVTGDVVMKAPLVVLPGTVVRFALTDDQRGGDDSERCELSLKRTFGIHGTSEEPIRFTSLSEVPSDGDWYGIRLSETAFAPSIEIGQTRFEYGISHYVVEHAQHGMFWQAHRGAPRLVLEQTIFYSSIWDRSYVRPDGRGTFLGNGDGQANAGENLCVGAGSIRNLSFQDADSVSVSISSEDPFVRFCPIRGTFPCPPLNIGRSLLHPEFGCTVASDAPAGHRILFRLDFAAPGIGMGQDTVVVEVAEGPDITSPYTRVDVSPKTVGVGLPIHIQALVAEGGGIARVIAEIQRDPEVTVDRVELHPVEGTPGHLSSRRPGPFDVSFEADVFEGEWIVPFEGNFHVQIDAEDGYGNRGKSQNMAGFSSLPFISSSDVVLITYRSPEDTRDPLIMRVLGQAGLSYDFWNTSYRGPMDSVAIAECNGRVLIWSEDRSWEQDYGLIAYLKEKGGLLICPSRASFPEDELAAYLGIERIPVTEDRINLISGEGVEGDPITDGLTLNGRSYPCTSNPCYVLSSLQPEAVPILRDANGYIVGMRVEKDGYRTVYLSVPLGFLGIEAEIQELIGRVVQWLQVPYTSVSFEEDIQPVRFALHPNHPNPFNTATVISYDLPKPGRVRLILYDLLGQMVRVLVDEPVPAGSHAVRWDGKDTAGRFLASGVYVCRLTGGSSLRTRKMALIR